MSQRAGGAVAAARLQLPQFAEAGTNQLFTDAQAVEYMQCSFGETYNVGHSTQVTLQRYPNNTAVWIGTLTSTFNQ